MRIREARLDDLAQLRELERAIIDAERAFDANLRDGDIAYYDMPALVSDADTSLLVAQDGDALVASAYASLRDAKASDRCERYAYVGFVYVAESQRGRGLARQLIDRLIGWTRERGVASLRLDVYHANAGARSLYDSLGFEPRLLEMRLDL